MNKIRFITSLILLTVFFSSCDQKDVYSHYVELKNFEWQQDSILAFDVDSTVIDLKKTYDITLDINSNVDYLYQNIVLLIEDNLASDTLETVTRQEYQLADSLGKWNGDGFAFIYRLTVPLYEECKFTEKRNYQFRIRHCMTDESLVGVEKIGLRITKRE